MTTVHGTCILIQETGVLLQGPPGCGKSDLALRLIDEGAMLVADDQVKLDQKEGRLWASAPQSIRDKIEIRGLGIMRLPAAAGAFLGLVVELVERDQVARLPPAQSRGVLGMDIPLIQQHAFDVSASNKIRWALRGLAGKLSNDEAVT